MSDTDAARLAKLEGKAETYDRMFVKMSDTLESINLALNKLVALEERHQALDSRHQQLRTDFTASMNRGGERMGKIEDRMRDMEGDSNPAMNHVRALEGRVRGLEGKVSVNDHGRSMWERVLAPLIASTVSGSLVALAVYLFLQNNTPTLG